MPPTSLVNILALGLVGVVTAGLYLLYNYNNSTEGPHENTGYQRSPRQRQQQRPRPSGPREKNDCFCKDDSRPINCYLRSCGHHFHRNCLELWAQEREKPSCPFCRVDFHLPLDLSFNSP